MTRHGSDQELTAAREASRAPRKHAGRAAAANGQRAALAVLILPVMGLWLAMSLLRASAMAAPPRVHSDPDFIIDTWETADGLPENSATSLVQTPDGYLWFGTFKGLVRFDGVRFTVFDRGNLPELPSDGIVNLHLDRKGRLWISTFEGLVVRSGNPDVPGSVSWQRFTSKEGWSGDYVRTFSERSNGDLLITTFNGQVMEYANDRLTTLPDPPGERGQGYFGHVDEEGQWWVVQYRFAGCWDGQRWIETVPVPSLAIDAVGCTRARDGGLWLLLGRELRKYRGRTETARLSLPESPGGVWSMFEDSHGAIWICTYTEGVCRISPTGEMRRWSTTTGLSYRSARFAFEDRERNVWIGTSGGGLVRFKPRRFLSLGFEDGLTERVVKSVWPDRAGGLWIASYGNGLFHWNGRAMTNVALPGLTSSFIYTQSVMVDRGHRTWVGTYQQGLWRSDSNRFERIPFEHTGGNSIAALFEDSKGRIWIGSSQVAVYENGRFRVLGAAPDSPLKGAHCFAEDSDGAIWLASGRGVFRWKDDECDPIRGGPPDLLRQVTSLKSGADGAMWMGSLNRGLWHWRQGRLVQLGPEAGLPVEDVQAIAEDDSAVFWLTSSRGIVRVARTELEEVVAGGRSRFSCQWLGLEDGLPSVECPSRVQPLCARDGAGRLWFATSRGVAMTDPARWQFNHLPPPIRIEAVTYQMPPSKSQRRNSPAARRQPGQLEQGLRSFPPAAAAVSLVPAEIRSNAPFAGPLVLPAGGQRLEIRYTALSFVAPEKVRFQVMLEGYDQDWRDAGHERVAQFLALPARSYLFRVRAANNDGVWNEEGASLAFVVQPFVWQTWWFRSSGALALVALSGWIVWRWSRLRHRQELIVLERTRQQQTELAHVARVSTMGELTASLAHELNQPLGAILSNAEAAEMLLDATPPKLTEVRDILADIRKDDERAGEVIRRLRALLHKREMERLPVALNTIVNDVLGLVQAEAGLRRTALTTELTPDLPPIVGDRIHLQQVLLNLIMNAFEAMAGLPTAQRRLTVHTSAPAPGVQEVSVTDSGSGLNVTQVERLFDPFFTTKANGMGMGLSIARRIIEAHQGRIWAENNPGGGATFRVRLPSSASPADLTCPSASK